MSDSESSSSFFTQPPKRIKIDDSEDEIAENKVSLAKHQSNNWWSTTFSCVQQGFQSWD
jgi:hypothetical protein